MISNENAGIDILEKKPETDFGGDSCASTSSSFCVKFSLFRFVRSNSSFGSKLWVDQWFIMNPY